MKMEKMVMMKEAKVMMKEANLIVKKKTKKASKVILTKKTNIVKMEMMKIEDLLKWKGNKRGKIQRTSKGCKDPSGSFE